MSYYQRCNCFWVLVLAVECFSLLTHRLVASGWKIMLCNAKLSCIPQPMCSCWWRWATFQTFLQASPAPSVTWQKWRDRSTATRYSACLLLPRMSPSSPLTKVGFVCLIANIFQSDTETVHRFFILNRCRLCNRHLLIWDQLSCCKVCYTQDWATLELMEHQNVYLWPGVVLQNTTLLSSDLANRGWYNMQVHSVRGWLEGMTVKWMWRITAFA